MAKNAWYRKYRELMERSCRNCGEVVSNGTFYNGMLFCNEGCKEEYKKENVEMFSVKEKEENA